MRPAQPRASEIPFHFDFIRYPQSAARAFHNDYVVAEGWATEGLIRVIAREREQRLGGDFGSQLVGGGDLAAYAGFHRFQLDAAGSEPGAGVFIVGPEIIA